MDQYLELLKLSETYRIILVANALISTVLYPYLLYLYFYRTPKEILTCMKINLLNATTTCYAIVIVLALWQPVPVMPLLVKHYTHNSPEELKEVIDDMAPSQFQTFIMTIAQHEPSFATYSRVKSTKGLGIIYLVFLTIIIVGEVVVITVMTYKTAKEIQLTKKFVLPTTHQIQMMVFRTFVLNSIFFLLFFLAPMTVVLLSLSGAFQSHWPSFIMYTLWSLHTPIIYIKLLFVMRPYRRFTSDLLIRTFSFIRCVKCKGTLEAKRLYQTSEQIPHTMTSTAHITNTGSEKVSNKNTRVHPIN
ncbi:serpentine type 7TM GPCR chemoreceptor srh domain-containing protein [Ditylenchus destructor]|uniref:Serpentine type 7TM GPCR chemoreceptor srh domain-containing protein n=1 Tax=Ditylenchus destructor TaxID=166010 RepID=A0AAD4MKS9_9BILA|nr:serpentine type 7TM GPCR chemoreceptor srh domain-containing protein [Ditylenchus destructor]